MGSARGYPCLSASWPLLSIQLSEQLIGAFLAVIMVAKLDMILMRIIDIIYGIPALIVNILVMVVLRSGYLRA